MGRSTARLEPPNRGARVVAALLRERRGDLTRAELRVAQTLLGDYPAAGLQPVASLASAAGVSGPTVVRLVAKLGFSGYAQLQQQLRRELSARSAGPVQLYPPADQPAGGSLLARLGQPLVRAVADTLRAADETELDRAITMLADPTRPAVLTGGRASVVHAYYMATYLRLLRPAVQFLPRDRASRTAALLDVGRSQVVTVFDFHRYERETVEFGRAASSRGATVVLFTDTYLSPLASAADVLLTASVEWSAPFITLTPVMGLVEATLLGVAERAGKAGRARLADFDELNAGTVG